MNNSILVTGATGNVGSEVVKFLKKQGYPYKAAVRGIQKAQAALGSDAICVRFDFEEPASYEESFSGVSKLFLVRPPALSDAKRQIFPVIDYARKVGVKHIVFLSLMGIERNPLPPHYKIESYIKESKIPYTFLRPGFFMQNLNEVHRFDIKEHNEIFIPVGKAKISFIDTRDIGEIGARVLVGEGHEGAAYTLTGKEALDYFEVADIFSSVLERTIKYTNPPLLKFRRVMLDRGNNKDFVNVMVALYLTTRLGLAKHITQTAGELLGRPPRTVKEYAHDYAGYWQ